jgi:hypothetical protein
MLTKPDSELLKLTKTILLEYFHGHWHKRADKYGWLWLANPYISRDFINTVTSSWFRSLILNVHNWLTLFCWTCRSEYSEAADGTYGNQDETGKWGGVVGLVSREDADVGINIMAYSTERINSVDFLPPIWTSKYLHKIFLVFMISLVCCTGYNV